MKFRVTSLFIGWIVGLISSTFVRRRLQRFIMSYAPERLHHQMEARRLEMVRTAKRLSSDLKVIGGRKKDKESQRSSLAS